MAPAQQDANNGCLKHLCKKGYAAQGACMGKTHLMEAVTTGTLGRLCQRPLASPWSV